MGKSKQQRKKDRKVVLMFDESERREFLSGFSKRKKERQRKAKEKALGKLEEERKKLFDEKRAIMADIVREGGITLQDPLNLEALSCEVQTVDCGEHTVTITELSDAYGAVQETANGLDEADSDNECNLLLNEDKLFAGSSAMDQKKIRLKQITQELKDFSTQMQPIKAALSEKTAKTKIRKKKAQERQEQEILRTKGKRAKGGRGRGGPRTKGEKVGIKKKKANKHIIRD